MLPQSEISPRNGLVFVALLPPALLIAYAVLHGLIAKGFIYTLAYFFDNVSITIKTCNPMADIALLILLLLALFGLYCFFKFFFAAAVLAVVIGVLSAWFICSDTPDLKPVKVNTPKHKEIHRYQEGG